MARQQGWPDLLDLGFVQVFGAVVAMIEGSGVVASGGHEGSGTREKKRKRGR